MQEWRLFADIINDVGLTLIKTPTRNGYNASGVSLSYFLMQEGYGLGLAPG